MLYLYVSIAFFAGLFIGSIATAKVAKWAISAQSPADQLTAAMNRFDRAVNR